MSVSIISPPRIKNQLLAALVGQDYQHLLPHLERVELSLCDVVYRADTEIQDVYFPETAVISLLATTEDGSTTEVGLVGYEGMVGLGVFLGGTITHDRAVVQVAGTAMKLRASVLRAELRVGSSLQLLLLRYTRAFLFLITQSVVCSQKHTVDQRLARWLMMMNDYVETSRLKLTQELIADMLGSRRSGVTEAIGRLRDSGLIKTSRGVVRIIDQEGLEARACECYGIIREEFDRLHSSQQSVSKSA